MEIRKRALAAAVAVAALSLAACSSTSDDTDTSASAAQLFDSSDATSRPCHGGEPPRQRPHETHSDKPSP